MTVATVSAGLGMRGLRGWADDDHDAAVSAFLRSADALPSEWSAAAQVTRGMPARRAFEAAFRTAPVVAPAFFTGYYEPEFIGARDRSDRYPHPLYGPPPGLVSGDPALTRKRIDAGALDGRGLELAWLADPFDAFMLHVQGSGRLRLPDGASMRIGFAAKNGHPYRSVGAELIRRGAVPEGGMSADVLREWVALNGEEGVALLRRNPSYVFFREVAGLAAGDGPVGAMGVPLTPMRSIAVDPAHVPLGAPVWVEVDGMAPRLTVAQDVGSAITGAGRADLFVGTGDVAGRTAGNLRRGGRITVLVPRH